MFFLILAVRASSCLTLGLICYYDDIMAVVFRIAKCIGVREIPERRWRTLGVEISWTSWWSLELEVNKGSSRERNSVLEKASWINKNNRHRSLIHGNKSVRSTVHSNQEGGLLQEALILAHRLFHFFFNLPQPHHHLSHSKLYLT